MPVGKLFSECFVAQESVQFTSSCRNVQCVLQVNYCLLRIRELVSHVERSLSRSRLKFSLC